MKEDSTFNVYFGVFFPDGFRLQIRSLVEGFLYYLNVFWHKQRFIHNSLYQSLRLQFFVSLERLLVVHVAQISVTCKIIKEKKETYGVLVWMVSVARSSQTVVSPWNIFNRIWTDARVHYLTFERCRVIYVTMATSEFDTAQTSNQWTRALVHGSMYAFILWRFSGAVLFMILWKLVNSAPLKCQISEFVYLSIASYSTN